MKVDFKCAAAEEAVYERPNECLSNPGPSRKDTLTKKTLFIIHYEVSPCSLLLYSLLLFITMKRLHVC